MGLFANILAAVVQWTAIIAVRLVLIVAGLPIVALALPFRKNELAIEDGRHIVDLPNWAWPYKNVFDGLLGDKRGWWDDNADSQVLFGIIPLLRKAGLKIPEIRSDHPLAMWWWSAVRNPANNLRRVPGLSCPVQECDIKAYGDDYVKDRQGHDGWQFVVAKRRGGSSRWYGFYVYYPWKVDKGFVFRIGYKIRPDYQDSNELPKGATFRFKPYTNIKKVG